MRTASSSLAIAAALACAAPALSDTATFTTAADVTLIQTIDGAQYALGAAYNFYCGRVGTNDDGLLRRAVMRFDVSSIPTGSTITAVTLRLYMSQSQSGAQTCSLYPMTASWGEGPSFAFGGGGTNAEPGDATWTHRFWPTTLWTTPGGDFSGTITASKSIGGAGFYTFASNAQMVADLQSWLNSPSTNYGWMMRGNEVTLQSAKKFDAKEITDITHRPLLTVTYTPPALTPGDLNGNGTVDGADLGILLAAWGATGPADLNHDDRVDGADLGILLSNWTV